ncbi:MAG TPA: UTP--glucose-1-phosphate uridylyltransferase GalU [Thermoanaerobaculia bacterium]|nr:UTP--glucose-1-phosphate uridylyltransferase GalU [Thermoanaerobaculia bacterium]
MKPLRTCVFPCAGYGTRFLPATKVIPKEMLPLVDKPVIQYGVEEAIESGLGRIVIITSRGKDSIIDHFDRSIELEVSLRQRQKQKLLEEMVEIAGLTHVISVRQKEQLGLGHAVLQAAPAVGEEPFAVVLPDDVILADPPCLHQMMEVHRETGRPVVALMEVSPSETGRYGIVAGSKVRERVWKIRDMVEKPKSNPPSNLAIIGRYILPPEIFPLLETTPRGAGGEIQLTDGLRGLIEKGDVYGYVFEGTRYDAGEKLGYLEATLDYALRHPTLGAAFRKSIEQALGRAPKTET